jgi:hypothetical protein
MSGNWLARSGVPEAAVCGARCNVFARTADNSDITVRAIIGTSGRGSEWKSDLAGQVPDRRRNSFYSF